MNSRVLYVVAAIFYAGLLFWVADTLSMADFEVDIFYGNVHTLLHYPLTLLAYYLGQTDLVVRGFMIALHLVTLFIYVHYTNRYLRYRRDRLWSLLIFMLLPGVVSSALMVHHAGLILLALLFYLWLFDTRPKIAWALLPLYLWIDNSFFILFVALSFYAMAQKKSLLVLYALVMAMVSFIMFGFDTNYIPRNYFLENFGVLSVVFSPLLFMYFIFTLFRFETINLHSLPWFVAMSAFWMVVVLSFRQPIPLEQFAPYVMILLPLMIKLFTHSYRMRIRPLRRTHKLIFVIALIFLILNSTMIYANKLLYLVLPNPKNHVLHNHHVVKELAQKLRSKGITKLSTPHPLLAKRLEFYGINQHASGYELHYDSCSNVTICYFRKEIATFCVTKKDIY